MEEKLIAEVQMFDFLYDPACRGYRDNRKTENAWASIAGALKLEGKYVKRIVLMYNYG